MMLQGVDLSRCTLAGAVQFRLFLLICFCLHVSLRCTAHGNDIQTGESYCIIVTIK